VSLDTKYRPRTFDDVLGQEATVRILRRFIATGKAYRQSYLFAGPFGSGKTTLGRILARGLLCEQPTEKGDPCDECSSCQSLLGGGTHTDFCEMDAATNSGKADITKIVEEIEFSTFSGRRRVYMLDESHRLSEQALDALLKPLEENAPGSLDKKLVCIFATTEPEKMRDTILSRCAPAFVIRPLSPEVIAGRLAYVCDEEGIEYEQGLLPLIAELTECHVRDALKAVEGISLLGPLTRDNVSLYLDLDLHDAYLDVLLNIGQDLPSAVQAAEKVLAKASPQTCYKRLATTSVMAYKVSLGIGKPQAFWDLEKVRAIGHKGNALLAYATLFSSRPGKPNSSMLFCDIAHLHHGGGTVLPVNAPKTHQTAPLQPPPVSESTPATPAPPPPKIDQLDPQTVGVDGTVGNSPPAGDVSVVVDTRGVKKSDRGEPTRSGETYELTVDKFCWLLGLRVAELDGARHGGPKGRSHMDRH